MEKGLLVKEIEEIRALQERLRNGEVKIDEYRALMDGFARTEKRASMVLQAAILVAKHGRKVSQLEAIGLVGDQAVELGMPSAEDELVYCPEANKAVSRRRCLDFSGKNVALCTEGLKCPKFGKTRELLLGVSGEQEGGSDV